MPDPMARHIERLRRAERKNHRRRIAEVREKTANRDMREGLREVERVG